MMRDVLLGGSLLLAVTANGVFAEDASVQAYLRDGYTIAGVFPSSAGPGLFLQKGATLIVCFVAEKPGSPTLATRYCKPVR